MPSDVTILFGGNSSERRVSVASAQHVSGFLPDATLWFWKPSGVVHEVTHDVLTAHQNTFTADLQLQGSARFHSLQEALDAPEVRGQVFFLALHGGEGEDGTVQRAFEARQLAFTASGSEASAKAFNKAQTKALAAEKAVEVARARMLPLMDEAAYLDCLRDLLQEHPRWVLKPIEDGSSNGLFHFTSKAQLPKAARMLATLRQNYLAEVFVEGRELTVGVIDEATNLLPLPLPVSEVRFAQGATFNFEEKYFGRSAQEITPAPLTNAESSAAQHLAMTMHQAVGCTGYSRTDMILTAHGPVLLEINTLPGLTKASFLPQQLATAGKDFKVFLDTQLQLGRRRAAS